MPIHLTCISLLRLLFQMILETFFIVSHSPVRPHNSLIILLADGNFQSNSHQVILGVRAFAAYHPWASCVRSFISLEVPPSTPPRVHVFISSLALSQTFGTSWLQLYRATDHWILKRYQDAVQWPFGHSLTEALAEEISGSKTPLDVLGQLGSGMALANFKQHDWYEKGNDDRNTVKHDMLKVNERDS